MFIPRLQNNHILLLFKSICKITMKIQPYPIRYTHYAVTPVILTPEPSYTNSWTQLNDLELIIHSNLQWKLHHYLPPYHHHHYSAIGTSNNAFSHPTPTNAIPSHSIRFNRYPPNSSSQKKETVVSVIMFSKTSESNKKRNHSSK